MDRLIQSCNECLQYPKNLLCHNALEHNLESYSSRLMTEADRMFVGDEEAAVDFLDFNSNSQEFQSSSIKSLAKLKKRLRVALDDKASDPHCRFISIHARHSLDPLRISLEMLCLLFSYLQVMPSFLDFIFPFGDQEYAQDFYFSGLREESVLYSRERGPAIQQLGRSGREIRLCYNLRSVEVSPKQKDFPWSIRQAAIYHHFDIETGKSAWITVKGNKVIQDRLSKLAGSWNGTEVSSISGAFAASLRAHLLLCDWSAEKWRWYINDLENGLQSLTRSALYTVVDRPPSPIFQSTSLTSAPMSPQSPTGTFSFASRRETINSLMSPRQRSGIPPSVPFGPAMTLSSLTQPPVASSEKGNGPGAWARMVSQVRTGAKSSLVSAFKGKAATMSWIICNKSGGDSTSASEKTQSTRTAQYERREPPPNEPPQLRQNGDNDSQEKFRFSDLQSMQYIEEKVQEALLVLRLNAEVLQDLREHYKYVVTHSECPSEIAIGCATEIMRFEKSVRNVEKDLRLQQSRTETLLHLLTERKTFLYGILQYQSMQASENFAKKAQVSAEKMEAMTVEMHSIAQKTKQETVSMRIITLVTLFFLPGTFIGTFFSTDIIQFENNIKHFQSQGLWLFLAICIPMMLLTLFAWYLVKRSVYGSAKPSQEMDAIGYSGIV